MFFNKNDFLPEELAEKCWTISQEAYEFGSPWKRNEFESDILNSQSEYLVLMEADEVVGFLAYHWVLDEAEVINVAVKKSHQQQGIGAQLLAQLLDQLGQKNIQQVFLEVRKSNESAQKLYLKENFHPVGVRKAYYSNPVEDGIVMRGKICQKLQET